MQPTCTDRVEWGAWGGEDADPAESHHLSTVTMKGEKEDAQKAPEGTHRPASPESLLIPQAQTLPEPPDSESILTRSLGDGFAQG